MEERAKDQAKAQLESISTMVIRLLHAQGECDGGGDCDLTDDEILEGLNLVGGEVTEEDRELYHDEENARETILEDPLSIEVRSGWHFPGSSDVDGGEYKILLCTGGPACRIIGKLNDYREPETASLQYQDWFTPWKNYPIDWDEKEALLVYARCFYFGE